MFQKIIKVPCQFTCSGEKKQLIFRYHRQNKAAGKKNLLLRDATTSFV